MKVVVIDDAATFRTQISLALSEVSGVEVVGTAANGKIGLDKVRQCAPDLVTLDLNMPIMGGLEFLDKLKELNTNCQVIVFAAKSSRSAKDTISALGKGAIDFIVKPEGNTYSIDGAMEQIKSQLLPKIMMLASRQTLSSMPSQMVSGSDVVVPSNAFSAPTVRSTKTVMKKSVVTFKPRAIVVASSTGGPGALEVFLKGLQENPTAPILIAQHMPEKFTKFLASRLQTISGIECREGEHNEVVKPGTIYIAPGNRHMLLEKSGTEAVIKINQNEKRHNVRPAADYLFESAADIYGANLAGFVLTGMGADGAKGSEYIRSMGGRIVIQDSESCVVWGMPGAAHELDAFDKVASLIECNHILTRMTR